LSFFENGQLIGKCELIDDLIDGKFVTYYKNGVKKEKLYYIDGNI